MRQDYELMAEAIHYLHQHRRAQPDLSELARQLGLSPWRLQRSFRRWTGISPKRLLQHLTLVEAKGRLREGKPVLTAALDSGLSGGSRLHDHFVVLESVTPGEYRNGGAGLDLHWGLAGSPFGAVLIAWTGRGINWLAFCDADSPATALAELQGEWPRASWVRDDAAAAVQANAAFATDRAVGEELRLWVRGTAFQFQVWRALLRIGSGTVSSYGGVAADIGQPAAARAVGSAIGANPVAWLIPCHRVLRQSGALGGYRWGLPRKQAMLTWEAAQRQGLEADPRVAEPG